MEGGSWDATLSHPWLNEGSGEMSTPDPRAVWECVREGTGPQVGRAGALGAPFLTLSPREQAASPAASEFCRGGV